MSGRGVAKRDGIRSRSSAEEKIRDPREMTRRGYLAKASCKNMTETERVLCAGSCVVRAILPCLEVAEFLRDNLSDVDAEPIDDPLSEIWMRGPAEDLDIRHSAL